MKCPCGSNQDFSQCCQPYLTGSAFPETAEQLMRSRYSAYVVADLAYIQKTLAPESQKNFDLKAAKQWAELSKWKGLKILTTDKGTAADKKGTVEFIATYESDGESFDHHEVSQFRRSEKGLWLYVDGDSHTHKEGEDPHLKPQTVIREFAKIGRNDPCSCGSGKKYKKCCGA